ncbi:uncharacterized protein LOC130383177 isoform X2 [Gadus chalcogrammus]|uniref:uncharacterized protein LOC130383177 isoform X2 n=1 Tax=Gadus chalcogrammus TaxID=1042646 RepID=UPI0024C41DD5|nr:uncharacterized protein LOC130383177 isoform X2 [Gadus chalcogrammus]
MDSRKTSNASASIEQGHDDDASISRSDTSVEGETQVDGPSRALEHLDLETLVEYLQVEQDASASVEDLIKRSAVKHFPSPPPGGDGVLTPELLREHLNVVRRAVHDELQRLNPLREKFKNLAGLVPSYHRLAMDLVHTLLKRISSPQQAFVLLEWLCNTYLSLGFMGDPDFSESKQRSSVDMHLYSATVECVNQTLRTTLEEVKSSLDEIIKRQEFEFWRSWELHKDVIKCIDGPIVRAESVSENVQEFTRQVCNPKLLEFLETLNTAKQKLLKRYEKDPKLKVETCLKTLNTLHGLVNYIQPSTDGGTKDLPAEKTLSSLRTLKTDAQASMEEAVVKIIKERLNGHFKSREEDFLLNEMQKMFRAEGCCPDVQKEALDLAYERVSTLYLYQLASTKKKKELEKRWGRDVGQKVTQDAQHLHKIFSDLHPGVGQQNHVLLKVEELIQSQDVDSVKITLSEMMQLCQSKKVKKLCSALLEWKGGLSVEQVKEVLACVEVLSTRDTSDSTGTSGPE